jgi:hypothetical protein
MDEIVGVADQAVEAECSTPPEYLHRPALSGPQF